MQTGRKSSLGKCSKTTLQRLLLLDEVAPFPGPLISLEGAVFAF